MRAWLRALFFGAGLGFMALASARTLAEGTGAIPRWPVLAGAAVLTAGSLMAAARGWAALLRGHGPDRALRAGFLGAQVGKYIPGGVWVGAGQLGLALEAGAPAARAAGALAVFGIALLAAGSAVAGALGAARAAVSGELGWPAVTAVGLLAPLLLDRRWMRVPVQAIGRRLERVLPGVTPVIPSQRAILRCFGWLVPSLALAAATFVLILASAGARDPLSMAVWAFAVAWLAGYLALGLPSGIGAREGVLVALLATGPGAVVAACLIHRLIQIGVEAALFAATRRAADRTRDAGETARRPRRPRFILTPKEASSCDA